MDWKMKKQLLDKYWKGETSLEEEQWLKANISSIEGELTKEERAYFEQLSAFTALSSEEAFDMTLFEEPSAEEAKVVSISFYQKISKIAVVALLLLVVGGGTYFMNLSDNSPIARVVEEEEDPQKAFEVAKASLLLISQKMNKGVTHVNALEKFDLAHGKINSNSKIN
ncbi:MAG: hypothetical protein ACI8YQ_001811 [Polaribacter sp.]|jgi:hypothetical protein